MTGPIDRRRSLHVLGGSLAGLAGVGLLAGCGSDGATSGAAPTTTSGGSGATSTSAAASTGASVASGDCAVIPEETAGPYPADGSNGPDVLSQDGVVRSDIRTGFAGASGTATGVLLGIELTIVSVSAGCTPLAGAAVYLWHADAQGRYSIYSEGVTDENYLRGVQVADDAGRLTFTSIYPGCYDGRWPHIHFEVYENEAEATGGGRKLRTSQIALTEGSAAALYATDGYGPSARNLARTSLDRDMVFADGASLQTPTVTGSTGDGYVIALTVPV